MENTLVWILVFAGATIGLLGTFLIASERELKIKRRDLAELEAKFEGNEPDSAVGQPGNVARADSPETVELIARNKQLQEEVLSLSGKLELSQRTIDELQSLEPRLQHTESETQRVHATNQQLREEITNLRRQLETNESRLKQSASENRDAIDRPYLETEIAELKRDLEAATAQARELEVVRLQLADFESREAAYENRQKKLEAQINELGREISEGEDKVRELGGLRSRLAETERNHQEARAENRRLLEEITLWRQRGAAAEDERSHFDNLRQHFDQLRVKQESILERHRQFQDDFVTFATLLDNWSEKFRPVEFQTASNPLETTPVEARRTAPVELPTDSDAHDASVRESEVTQREPQAAAAVSQKRRRRFGIFPVIAVFAVASAVTAGYWGHRSNEPAAASKVSTVAPESAKVKRSANADAAFKNSPSLTEASNAIDDPESKPVAPVLATTKRLNFAPQNPRGQNEPLRQKPPTKPAQRVEDMYEITRPTEIYSGPAENSQLIAHAEPGMKINVVTSRDGWLEIHSKYGRPPGFIKKDAAVKIGRN
jgi:myosin heavy subunit